MSPAVRLLTITLSGVSDMADKNLRNSLTAEQLRAALTYDPATGIFTWRDRPDMPKEWNLRWAGKTAGSWSHGHRYIIVNWISYKAARLAWLYMTGEWPPAVVDHKDTKKGNDAWANLRAATRSQNSMNVGLHPRNKTGYRGVFQRENRRGPVWDAKIFIAGRSQRLGTYATPQEAGAAYEAAAERLHGEFK